jgi:hypothetical protein
MNGEKNIFQNSAAFFSAQLRRRSSRRLYRSGDRTIGRLRLPFESVLDAFVYSNCIGTLTGCVVILGVPAWREYNPFFRFVFLTAAILGATLLGIAAANIILALLTRNRPGVIPS